MLWLMYVIFEENKYLTFFFPYYFHKHVDNKIVLK